ncbi:MAG: hypothetical protein VX367_13845 [SAR324 cluster bacterium]|nr:hypothetical protein [SAR324 cluster bacterium]
MKGRLPQEEEAEAVEEANSAAEEAAVVAEEAVASRGEIATSIGNRPIPNLRSNPPRNAKAEEKEIGELTRLLIKSMISLIENEKNSCRGPFEPSLITPTCGNCESVIVALYLFVAFLLVLKDAIEDAAAAAAAAPAGKILVRLCTFSLAP